jgi:hypothetical protein
VPFRETGATEEHESFRLGRGASAVQYLSKDLSKKTTVSARTVLELEPQPFSGHPTALHCLRNDGPDERDVLD